MYLKTYVLSTGKTGNNVIQCFEHQLVVGTKECRRSTWNGWAKCEKLQALSAVIQELRSFGSKSLQMDKNQTGAPAYPGTANAAARKKSSQRRKWVVWHCFGSSLRDGCSTNLNFCFSWLQNFCYCTTRAIFRHHESKYNVWSMCCSLNDDCSVSVP